MSFKIIPSDTVEDWSSILHATIGENVERDGDCTPAIWFTPNSLKPFICSSVNGNKYYCYTMAELTLNIETTVQVQQIQSLENYLYYYSILINGNLIKHEINKKPQIFKDVKYYAGDPWYKPAQATIKDFHLTTYEHKGFKKIQSFLHLLFLHILFRTESYFWGIGLTHFNIWTKRTLNLLSWL